MQKQNDKILLFIPCYNCVKQIDRVLTQVQQSKCVSYFTQIILVDNGSSDGTRERVKELIERSPLPLRLLLNTENYGLGGSHKVAFSYALEHKFDYMVTLHGDCQANINDLLPVLENGSYTQADCCLGARFMRKSVRVNYSKIRTYGNYVFNVYYSLFLGRIFKDLGSGLNMYKMSFIQKVFPALLRCQDGLNFNPDTLCVWVYYQAKLLFFPISWAETDQVSNLKIVRHLWAFFHIPLMYRLSPSRYIAKEHRVCAFKTYAYTSWDKESAT